MKILQWMQRGLPVWFVVLVNFLLLSIFFVIVNLNIKIAYLICEAIFSLDISNNAHGEHVALRISLHIFSILVSFLLISIILLLGIAEFKNKVNIISRWKSGAFTLVFTAVLWLGYPIFALDGNYFSTNRVMYLIMTSIVFSVNHILFGVIRK